MAQRTDETTRTCPGRGEDCTPYAPAEATFEDSECCGGPHPDTEPPEADTIGLCHCYSPAHEPPCCCSD